MSFLKYILLFFFVAAVNSTKACDVCAGGSRFSFSGLRPLNQQHFVALSHQYQSFKHPLSSFSSSGEGRVLRDSYQSINVEGLYSLGKKWQLGIMVPFKTHSRIEEHRETQIRGVGDITVGPSFRWLSIANDSSLFKHFLRAEFMLGLPTGKYMQRDASLSMLPAFFQLGTGAWSYALNLRYSLIMGDLGISLSTSYTQFSSNELDYKLGSISSIDLPLFYLFRLGTWEIIPQVGMTYENISRDSQYGVLNQNTGSSRYLFSSVLSIKRGAWIASFSARSVVNQQLPELQPRASKQWFVRLLYGL